MYELIRHVACSWLRATGLNQLHKSCSYQHSGLSCYLALLWQYWASVSFYGEMAPRTLLDCACFRERFEGAVLALNPMTLTSDLCNTTTPSFPLRCITTCPPFSIPHTHTKSKGMCEWEAKQLTTISFKVFTRSLHVKNKSLYRLNQVGLENRGRR